ncbi:BgTH12-01088 [Blumeria graminis f. sp. triticale]|uniref:BgTH12-01088 n=1 Tax=Blumeria graminis f. sp. triticale TaxID=1689686 RepID=A0A9W4GI57_BLUGR|nr:BgTH12-01088 [Blumeria graminis f. sp. triticale]
MYCLLAILLLTGHEAKNNDRLAIMKFEQNSKFYRIYRTGGMREFPGIKAGSDVIMATSRTNGPGTYMTIYCTPSHDSTYLRRAITRGIREMEDNSHIGFHQPLSEETICLHHIKEQLRKHSRNRDINIKELDETLCSTSTVYTLAIQNNFYVQSIHHGTLTPTKSNLQRILSDDLFPMSDLVLGSNFICEGETNGLQTVLAWHQGYLNLFQKDNRNNSWLLVRKNSPRGYDYHPIIDFIAKHFDEVGSIRSALMLDGDTADLSTNDSHFRKSNSLTRQQNIRELLVYLGQKNLRLTESPAYGFLGQL